MSSIILPPSNRIKDVHTLNLGHNLEILQDCGMKLPIITDISPRTNSHMLISGMSGGGKSFFEQILFAKLAKHGGEFYFADYKGDDSFSYLRDCPRYFSFKNTLEALDIVYSRLNARLSGEDTTRHAVTLIWDEYIANILALTNEDKKLAAAVMNKVSEILLMGRSMSVRLVASMQRPDALAFPVGSRLNFGVVIILGAAVRSIYEMLMPDHMEQVEGRNFGRGEGVVLLQGSKLRFIKVLAPCNIERMKKLCVKALS
jgi:hypothetical protein